MEDKTIVAQRIVVDAIRLADMNITKMDISKKMMADVMQSHAPYKSSLNARKTSSLRKNT